MSMKVFIYPSVGKAAVILNPYLNNLKDSLGIQMEVINPKNRLKLPRMLVFLCNSFKANVYVLNWIENSASGRLGFIGALMCLIGLRIVNLRRTKIVWLFHNIHPHEGESYWSKKIKQFLFNKASFIVSHSQEAAEYARKYAACPVYFKNHPMKKVDYGEWDGVVRDCDFFYWSDIYPYKGVVEFLSNPRCCESGKKIFVLGKSVSDTIRNEIESLTGENIIYENRQASFSEIAAQCKNAKYVIFPYVGESISSSGVLMDTLLMGGTPVGPNRGAFADLAEQGCCITYSTLDEVFSLPTDSKECVKLCPDTVKEFIDNNSWDSFGKWMYDTLLKVK